MTDHSYAREVIGKEIHEVRRWEFDGDLQRKVPVFDRNFAPPRLVRYAGWRPCLKCREPHFTPDISRIRLCQPCKTTYQPDRGFDKDGKRR